LAGFESVVEELTFAVLLTTEPTGVDGLTLMVSSREEVVPPPRDEIVLVTLPVLPTAGVVLAQPVGTTSETKVVLAGNTSNTTTLAAGSGPLLSTLMR
jgi:hypothetical protein